MNYLSGITDIAFIVGGIGLDKVKEYYENGEKFGAKFSYIKQDFPLGIAHAISLCEEFVNNEKFIVFLGDNIIQREINDYACLGKTKQGLIEQIDYLKNESVRKDLGKKLRNEISRKYNAEIEIEKLIKIYNELT